MLASASLVKGDSQFVFPGRFDAPFCTFRPGAGLAFVQWGVALFRFPFVERTLLLLKCFACRRSL